MKKNKVILIIIFLLVSWFAFGINAKADDCSSKSCFCAANNPEDCRLLRNPAGTHTISSDMTKCGCNPTGKNPVNTTVSGGGGSTGTSTAGTNNEGINVCENSGIVKSAQIIGWCLFVLKIVVPIVLIIMAMVEIGKAVIASDDKAIHNAIMSLVKKGIAAVIIFFVPSVVALVIHAIGTSSEALGEFDCLSKCINHPSECTMPSGGVFGSDSDS